MLDDGIVGLRLFAGFQKMRDLLALSVTVDSSLWWKQVDQNTTYRHQPQLRGMFAKSLPAHINGFQLSYV